MLDFLRRGKGSADQPLPEGTPAAQFTPGRAYWQQREALAKSRERIAALSAAVGRTADLTLFQFAQLLAAAIDFAPDLIVELGRGLGNSTCVFTEAANQLGGGCRVLSLCNSVEWEKVTTPKLKAIVPKTWFAPLKAVTTDILTYNFEKALANAKRVMLFWDAHGFEVAECVLSVILPVISKGEHIVCMHDMSDARYAGSDDYAGQELWKGRNAENARFRVGIVDSAVAQAFVVQDFTQRNRITLDSADHSFDLEFRQQPERAEEMRRLLGDDLFAVQGHWFWFTMSERPGPYTFPAAPGR